MKNIKVLDCTLRDGGYINNWNFGFKNIKYIYKNLCDSKMDFIEIGYLDNKEKLDSNYTKYYNIKNIDIELDSKSNNICMINYGDFDVEKLEKCNKDSKIKGIRLAFHKKDLNDAIYACKKIMDKGYILFVQPMVTINYSNNELIDLIKIVNDLNPYAFYIVDSFGSMDEKYIKETISLVDSNLNKNISLGFHSHNNLQLALSNSKLFLKLDRNIIIDSSVYGMGRGAGNLASEMFLGYLNEKYNFKYDIDKILDIISNISSVIRVENYWGYSIEYFISAKYNCHPNYSKFLVDKQTINITDVKNIISRIEENKKYLFDKDYIENLYEKYMDNNFDDSDSFDYLKSKLKDKKILLIGPGVTSKTYKEEIIKFQKDKNVISILINHLNKNMDCDYIFMSNRKRFSTIEDDLSGKKLIITSNINKNYRDSIVFNYFSNLFNTEDPTDNSLLMFLNIISKISNYDVYLAGFDGFEVDIKNNYSDDSYYYKIDRKRVENLNDCMIKNLRKLKKDLNIKFITPSIYEEMIK